MLTLYAASFEFLNPCGSVDWCNAENGRFGIYLSEYIMSVFDRKHDAHAYLYARCEGRASHESRYDS